MYLSNQVACLFDKFIGNIFPLLVIGILVRRFDAWALGVDHMADQTLNVAHVVVLERCKMLFAVLQGLKLAFGLENMKETKTMKLKFEVRWRSIFRNLRTILFRPFQSGIQILCFDLEAPISSLFPKHLDLMLTSFRID